MMHPDLCCDFPACMRSMLCHPKALGHDAVLCVCLPACCLLLLPDTRHTGIMIMRKACMTEPSQVNLTGSLLVGRSSPTVCAACMRRTGTTADGADPGCHPLLSSKSYDKASPFGPSVGMASPVFALDFTVGPREWVLSRGCCFHHDLWEIHDNTWAASASHTAHALAVFCDMTPYSIR